MITDTTAKVHLALTLAEEIAQRCEDAHPYQDEWRARCPNHQGTSDTSLSITPHEDRVLVHCHGGCTVQDIVHALGLTLADLFVRKPEQRNGHRRIAKTYDYYDATGTLAHQTVRYDPKAFNQRRPDPVTPGAWVWKLDGIQPVLYRLPQVLSAIQRSETIYVVEGEKDVQTVESVGLPATCNPMGAGSWRPWYSETLRGCDVVILPDHDEKGAKHGQQVAVSLAGIARSVKVVPGIHTEASGSDVSDWLRQGGSREALDAAVQACPAWTPEEVRQDDAPLGKQRVPHAIIEQMDTVESTPVDWLWEPYLALGKLCILDGDPGVGKTLLALQIAANLSRGFPFPDQHGKLTLSAGAPAPTLFVAMEDDLADTVKPRLERAGADCRLIHVVNDYEDEHGKRHRLTLDNITYLEESIQAVQPRLVVIDSIQSVLGGKVDIHRANQVDEKVNLLADLAQRYHFALLCIRHPAKPGQNFAKLIHRGMGSVAFIGKARLGLFVEEHPTDRTLVLLVQAKSNSGAPGRTQIYSKREGMFTWAGVTRLTSLDLAGSGHGPDPYAFLGAYLWLEHRLRDGDEHPAPAVQDDAEAADISKKVLTLAGKRLQVVKRQLTTGWTWRLPPLPRTQPTGSTGVTGLTGSTGYSDSVTGGNDPLPPHDSDTPDTPDTPEDPVSLVVSPVAPAPFCDGGGVVIAAALVDGHSGDTRPVATERMTLEQVVELGHELIALEAGRCPDGGDHNWHAWPRYPDRPRFCSRCDAEEVQP